LDDSDGEAANESDGEVGFDLSALLNQAAQAPRLTQSNVAQGVEVVKRRITGKRAADGTDFPAKALISKAEQARLKSIEVEQQAKVRRLNKAAMTAATRALAQNPELSTGAGEERQSQEEEVDNPLAPHTSHDIRQMATHPYSYCNRCSHFSLHGTHSKLKKPCEPLKSGNRYTLRLLQCDVVPCKGAKVPLEFRKRNWAPFKKRGG